MLGEHKSPKKTYFAILINFGEEKKSWNHILIRRLIILMQSPCTRLAMHYVVLNCLFSEL